MPYSDYAVAQDIPELLDETASLIATSAASGIPDTHLAPLRNLVTEGAFLAINPSVTPSAWLIFSSRLRGALVAFECEVVLPLLEVADVAAIA